jgi:N-acetylmuramoyl-L-alanine amidase
MNRKGKIYKSYFNILFLLMICMSVLLLRDPTLNVMQQSMEALGATGKDKVTVVIDPGHGGRDPGKVGVNGALEKDINLSIALKLKELLTQNDINVIMIREDDIGLYSESDSNKKMADMRKRVDIINNSDAVLSISIHQNSFTQESVKGAQVFYYSNSKEGKRYADIMQTQLIKSLQDGNKKKAKANDNYYMLKKTNCPIVIVECGYLSNYSESELLIKEDYQEKLAWSIHLGLLTYMNQKLEESESMKIN